MNPSTTKYKTPKMQTANSNKTKQALVQLPLMLSSHKTDQIHSNSKVRALEIHQALQ